MKGCEFAEAFVRLGTDREAQDSDCHQSYTKQLLHNEDTSYEGFG